MARSRTSLKIAWCLESFAVSTPGTNIIVILEEENKMINDQILWIPSTNTLADLFLS